MESMLRAGNDAHRNESQTIAATTTGNGTEKSNVLAFRARTVAPLQMAA